MASRLPRQRREEIQDALPHLRVIEAEAGRSLRLHYIAAVGDEFAVRIPHADPVGSRIDVDLDDCPQAGFIRQLEHLAELPQIILIGGWLGRGPVHPSLHGVEPKVLDLFQILPPDLTVPLGIGLEHRRTSLAAAIPHSERKEGILTLAARLFFREIGGRSRRGNGERQEQGEGADNTEPQGGWSEHDTSPATRSLQFLGPPGREHDLVTYFPDKPGLIWKICYRICGIVYLTLSPNLGIESQQGVLVYCYLFQRF